MTKFFFQWERISRFFPHYCGIFGKNFVKVTDLPKKSLNSWFDEFVFSVPQKKFPWNQLFSKNVYWFDEKNVDYCDFTKLTWWLKLRHWTVGRGCFFWNVEVWLFKTRKKYSIYRCRFVWLKYRKLQFIPPRPIVKVQYILTYQSLIWID